MTDASGLSADSKRSSRRKVVYWLLLLAALAVAVFAGLTWRKHSINRPVVAALAGETGAETQVYRRALLGGDDLVFDVRSVGGEMSMVDMTRRLLTTAEALKNHDFNRVYLASRGREKFYFEGAYFKKIGEERQLQNPVYTIRTMPENVHALDGATPFGTWTGGLLGVIGEQMEDNAQFHQEWWVDDALAAIRN